MCLVENEQTNSYFMEAFMIFDREGASEVQLRLCRSQTSESFKAPVFVKLESAGEFIPRWVSKKTVFLIILNVIKIAQQNMLRHDMYQRMELSNLQSLALF